MAQEELSEVSLSKLRSIVQRSGLEHLTSALPLHRETILRALSGLPIRKSNAMLINVYLNGDLP